MRLALTATPTELDIAANSPAFHEVHPAWFTTLASTERAAPFTTADDSTTTAGLLATPSGVDADGAAGSGSGDRAKNVPSAAAAANDTESWIVRLSAGLLDDVKSVVAAADYLEAAIPGVTVVRGLGLPGQLLVDVDAAGVTGFDIEARLANTPGVSWAHPNDRIAARRTPDDPRFGSLYALENTGQSGGTPGADIDATTAWDVSIGSSSIVVGVIDEGIDYRHVDLAANMWTNPKEIAANGIDDDGNGFIDDVHGYDFYNDRGDVFSAAEGDLHGTHVAGTIGAVGDNAIGVVGVNWQTSLMSLKFLGPDGGYTSDAILAVNYATMMRTTYGVNVRVTNNSWGGGSFSQGLLDAINAGGTAGILFVAAAGNDGNDNDALASYPASYTSPYIVSVAATDRNDALASFSNYGLTSVDLGAPGVSILSTVPGNSYASLSGTSMASPHVAGAAALALSVAPSLSVTELRDLLLSTTDPIPSLAGRTATGGRLNANALVRALGLSVASTIPAVGSVVTAAPTAFTIALTDAVDPASIQPGDLTVNGVAADAAALVDTRTIRFDFTASPVTADGQQTMAIAAGALLRSSDGAASSGFSGSFRYDAAPLTVVATNPASGSVVPLPFTAIDVEFAEDVLPASVGANDLVLSQGAVASAELLSARIVRYALTSLTKEAVLDVSLPAGAVTDTFGNPSLPYTGSYRLDIDTVAIPTPLVPIAPLGGLIYRGSQAGLLYGAGDEDAFTIPLDAGQSLAVAVTPAAGLSPTLTLRAPDGSETSGSASASGEVVFVEPVIATTAGTWTIRVGNAGSASGGYVVDVLFDAAFERESLGDPANNTPADAQSLVDAIISIAGAGRPAAVGRVTAGDIDIYAIDVSAGQRISLVAASATNVSLQLRLFGPTGAVVATGGARGSLQSVIDGFVAADGGTYRIEVSGDGPAEYGVVAVLGGRFGVESDDSLASAETISLGDVVLAHVGQAWNEEDSGFEVTGTPVSLGFDSVGDFGGDTIGQVWNGTECHWFSTFTLAIGDTNYNNTWFFDFTPTPFPVAVSRHREGTTDLVRVVGEPRAGVVFERLVRRRDGDDHVTITTTVRNDSATALEGVALLESQNPDPDAEWYTANDVTRDGQLVVASISGAALGLATTDPRAVASAEGTVFGGYIVGDPGDVLLSPADPDGAVDDIALNLAFDIGTLEAGAETSATFVMVFGDSQAAVEATFDDLVIQPASTDVADVYRVALPADERVTITVLTPAAGPVTADGPDVRLELLDASGGLLASADGTAGLTDATIQHDTAAPGDAFVRVSIAPGSSRREGSYALRVVAQPVNEPPIALALTPATATLAENTPTAERIRLADILVTDDARGTLAISLVGPDASFFETDATGLFLAAGTVLDFEARSTYDVTVVVTDPTLPDAPPLTAGFTLTVNDVNEPPSALALVPASVTLPENTSTAARIRLADILVTDDARGTLAVSLVGPDAAFFEADATGLFLAAGTVLDFEARSTYDVTVVVADPTLPDAPPLTAGFTLTVSDVNEPPSALVLAPATATLPENTSTTARIRLADILVTDDARGTLAISLVGPDASFFEADATGLFLAAGTVLDFESRAAYEVTVVVTDPTLPDAPPLTAGFSLTVSDVNEPPVALVLAPAIATLPENTPTTARIRLADILVTDDARGTLAVSLVGPDASFFEADATGLFLAAGTVLDFESRAAYEVTVVVTDPTLPEAPPLTAGFTLTVSDVNEPPTALVLSSTTIEENNSPGTVIGVLSVLDPDVDEVIAYELVPGDGDMGNAAFGIVGNLLVADERFNFEIQDRYSIRVRATDTAGSVTEAVFEINVTDLAAEPLEIERITLPAPGTYRIGDRLVVTIVVSRPVKVRGRPLLRLRIGRDMRQAALVGGDGSSELAFAYRVRSGDPTGPLALGALVELPRRAVIAAGGTRLPTALPNQYRGLEATEVFVDGQPPRTVGRVAILRRGDQSNDRVRAISVTFSEDVLVDGVPRIAVRIGSTSRFAEYVAGSGSRTLRFEFVMPTVRRRTLAISRRIIGGLITDAVGNVAEVDLAVPRKARL